MISNRKTIKVLNKLIQINNDRFEDYETAYKETDGQDLKTYFSKCMQTSQNCKQELMDDSFNLIGSPLVDQPYSYTGQRLDTESGLQYYRARYFDNDMGRFISRDPIGYVDGLNLYRGYFVPRLVDPNGTIAIPPACVVCLGGTLVPIMGRNPT